MVSNIYPIVEIVQKQHGRVRHVDANFYTRALADAIQVSDCYLSFWIHDDIRYLTIYRKDHKPNNAEVMPWLEALFMDGQIHELEPTQYSRHFLQGERIYSVDTVADLAANAFTEGANKDSNASAFDFDKTELGKKLIRDAEQS